MGIIRKTKSVKALLDIFKQSNDAWSVVDLVDKLSDQMNKTTVYRILERFEDEGILHSFNGKNGIKWYAKCKTCSEHGHSDKHPHFQCKDCGKVECLPVEYDIPDLSNYKIDTIQVILSGQCSDCS